MSRFAAIIAPKGQHHIQPLYQAQLLALLMIGYLSCSMVCQKIHVFLRQQVGVLAIIIELMMVYAVIIGVAVEAIIIIITQAMAHSNLTISFTPSTDCTR